MNFYKNINTFLLERYPTCWNTRFVWMVLIGLCTHLLFLGIGYGALNFEVLKDYGIRDFFFKKGFAVFYAIIGLVSLIYFGLKYFAHNPFKNFYPVSQTYFWKILGQLFLMFFIYFTVFISFENGLKFKASKIVPINTIEAETNMVNTAKPFLFTNINDYHIKNRNYPEPFPCEDITGFTIGYDTVDNVSISHGIDTKKPYLNFNGSLYQYGKLRSKDIDECHTEPTLDTIYDLNKIYGIDEYSLYNFSNFENTNNTVDIDYILKQVHHWYQNRDSIAIAKTIQDLKNICKKYNISEQLNPAKMTSAILKQNLNKQQLISAGFYDYKLNDGIPSSVDVATEATVVSASADTGNENNDNSIKKNIDYNYSIDMNSFATITENVEKINNDLGTNQIFKSNFWLVVFLSFGFALFFVMVKYIPLKELIIGIVIAAVLLAVVGLIAITNNINNERSTLSLGVFYSAVIICIGLYGIYSTNIKKALVSKWMVSFYTSILCIIPLTIVLVREITSSEVIAKCQTYTNTVYLYEFNPWQFLISALIAVFFIFKLMRRVHAKVE